MPYKLSTIGKNIIKSGPRLQGRSDLTDMQKQAMEYLYNRWMDGDDRYIHANEIATYYGYKSGLWMRGPLAALHARGFIDKDPSEL